MKPRDFHDLILRPALDWLGPPYAHSDAARFLVAAAVQESDLRYRRQKPSGPGRSFYQIEPQTMQAVVRKWPEAKMRLRALGIRPPATVGEIKPHQIPWLEFNDIAACVIARGILWLDAYPLPTTEAEAWKCYADRTWKPSKPRPDRWSPSWRAGCEAVG